MYDCSACTLRALRAIAKDVPQSRRLLLTPHLTRRTASTTVASSATTGEPYLNAAQLRHQELAQSSSTRKQEVPLIRKHEVGINDQTGLEVEKKLAKANARNLQRELQWLTDPAKLAAHIHYVLRRGEADKALELCRMASRSMACVVSWNHIVDHHMKQGHVNEALKVFNEMKKRAQFPDAHTYTLLLRGLTRGESGYEGKTRRENVSKALSLYYSMSSPTSRVQPSIIHTNAVLKVCTFGRDPDALWGVVAKLPEAGPGAADTVTYSIILHALRWEILSLDEDIPPEQLVRKKEEGVNQGRKVWMEVVKKWRSGVLKIDEELVCAMGRLLMCSDRLPDWDAALSLVQQTTGVPRLIPEYGTQGRETGHVPVVNAYDLPDEPSPSEQERLDRTQDTPFAKAFNPVAATSSESSSSKAIAKSLAYVEPGNGLLSLLILTCTRMRIPKTAVAYWNTLTAEPYKVKPDIHNFNALLRLFQKNRSSARAAELLTNDLVEAGIQPYSITFRLAMEACARDWKNANALESARQIVDVMEKTMADLDVEVLKGYVSLALHTHDGPKIVSMLDRCDRLVHNLRSRVTYGLSQSPESRALARTERSGRRSSSMVVSKAGMRDVMSPQDRALRDKVGILGFIRVLISAIDTLMNRDLVPKEKFDHWKARRWQLQGWCERVQKSLGPRWEALKQEESAEKEVPFDRMGTEGKRAERLVKALRGFRRSGGRRVGEERPERLP